MGERWSIERAALEALLLEDACNLSGVVLAFAAAVLAVGDEARRQGHGTAWANGHPVCLLFANKVQALASGREPLDFTVWYTARAACRALAGESDG